MLHHSSHADGVAADHAEPDGGGNGHADENPPAACDAGGWGLLQGRVPVHLLVDGWDQTWRNRHAASDAVGYGDRRLQGRGSVDLTLTELALRDAAEAAAGLAAAAAADEQGHLRNCRAMMMAKQHALALVMLLEGLLGQAWSKHRDAVCSVALLKLLNDPPEGLLSQPQGAPGLLAKCLQPFPNEGHLQSKPHSVMVCLDKNYVSTRFATYAPGQIDIMSCINTAKIQDLSSICGLCSSPVDRAAGRLCNCVGTTLYTVCISET